MLAKKAFKALNGNLIGRIDIKMDDNNTPYFIEANLMPGLKKGYFYRSCAINLNINYEQMILKIVQNALCLSNNKAYLETAIKDEGFDKGSSKTQEELTPIRPEVQKLIKELGVLKALHM